MDTIQYTTKPGERWDAISFKMYGSVSEMQRIISANPQFPIHTRLNGGKVLEIPVLESNNIVLDDNQLPPWKR